MSNTWTPVNGVIVFDPEAGQRYVYRDGEWIPIPEWKDEPSPLDCPDCDGIGWYGMQIDEGNNEQVQCRECGGTGRVDTPITPEALWREGWIHIPETDVVYERWLSSDEDMPYILIILRGAEQSISIQYGELDFEYVELPGVRTLQQLAALVEMLGG